MAAVMASLNVAAAVPVAVSPSKDMSSLNVGSSANFAGMRLCSATTAAPNVSRSSRSLVVRAEQEASLWENIQSAFGVGKKKATEATSQAQKELNKATSEAEKQLNKATGEAKKESGGFGGKAESVKGETQSQAEKAADQVKAGIEDLQSKVEDAVESAQKN